MANRRSDITVSVQGISELRSLNTSLNTYEKHIGNITDLHQKYGASFIPAIKGTEGMTQAQGKELIAAARLNAELLKSIDTHLKAGAAARKGGEESERASRGHDTLVVSLLKYRGAAAAIGMVESALRSAGQAWVEYDRQARRTTRITGPQDYGIAKSGIQLAGVKYNADPKDAGEAYYQLSTFIGDATTRAQTFDNTMKMLAGTEGDSREVTRAMVSIYEQFADQLGGPNITQAEKYRRVMELMTVAFKDSHLEINELAQSMKYLGPIAEATHMKLADTVALVSTLAFLGQRGRMGGTGGAALAQRFLTQWNPEVQGVEKSGKIYHYDLKFDKDGNFDLRETIRRLDEYKRSLPIREQAEYTRAIAGSVNAWRALMAAGTPEGMKRWAMETTRSMDALKGKTDELTKMSGERLNTFADQFGRVWHGVIADISDGFDDIARRTGLLPSMKAIADALESGRKGEMGIQTRFESGPDTEKSRARLQTLDRAQMVYNRTAGLPHNPRPAEVYTPEAGFTKYEQDWLSKIGVTEGGLILPDKLAIAIATQHGAYDHDVAMARKAAKAAESTQSGLFKGMNPTFAEQLRQFIADSGGKLHITDGARTLEQQADLYKRKPGLAAHPTPNAPHVRGVAADLAGDLDWAHAHAADYGLTFPMLTHQPGHKFEPWHVELEHSAGLGPAIEQSDKGAKAAASKEKTARRSQADALRKQADDLEQQGLEILDDVKSENRAPTRSEMARIRKIAEQVITLRDRANRLTGDPRNTRTQRKADALLEKAKELSTDFRKNTLESAKNQMGMYQKAFEGTPLEPMFAFMGEGYANVLAKGEEDPFARAEATTSLALGNGPFGTYVREAMKKQYDEKQSTVRSSWAPFSSLLSKMGEVSFSDSLPEVLKKSAEEAKYRVMEAATDRDLFSSMGPQDLLRAKGSDLQREIAEQKAHGTTEKTSASLRDMERDLARVNKEIEEFIRQDFARHMERLANAAGRRMEDENFGFEMSSYPVSGRDSFRYGQMRNRMERNLRQSQFERAGFDALNGVPGAGEEARRLGFDVRRLDHEYAFNDASRRTQAQDAIASGVSEGMVRWVRGDGSLKDVFKSLGDRIMDSALDAFMRPIIDPLSGAISNEILALNDSTSAIKNLNSILTGGSGNVGTTTATAGLPKSIGESAGAAVAGSLASLFAVPPSGTSPSNSEGHSRRPGQLPGNMGKWNTGDAVNAGMAAYSVFQTGSEHGVTLANVLGAGLAGFQMGGPVGAGIGVGLDLLGGLFGHKKPDTTNQDVNPSFYNSPDQMVYEAYRYRATGKTTGPTAPFANAPIVNVTVKLDGVTRAVKTAIGNQVDLGNIAQFNTNKDIHGPI
jgi:hypothetical protein